MKKITLTLLLLGSLPVFSQTPPDFEQFRQKFWEQLALTCSNLVQWEKSVEELDEGDGSSKQSKVFTVDCRKGTAVESATGKETVLAPSEFAELFKYRYDDPYLKDYLHVTTAGGGVRAELPEEKTGKIALQKQVFEVDSASGVLRFAEVRVLKSNLLYDFDLRTRVWFDENGLYQRHTTETFTKVVLSGSVRTVIEGKRLS